MNDAQRQSEQQMNDPNALMVKFDSDAVVAGLKRRIGDLTETNLILESALRMAQAELAEAQRERDVAISARDLLEQRLNGTPDDADASAPTGG